LFKNHIIWMTKLAIPLSETGAQGFIIKFKRRLISQIKVLINYSTEAELVDLPAAGRRAGFKIL